MHLRPLTIALLSAALLIACGEAATEAPGEGTGSTSGAAGIDAFSTASADATSTVTDTSEASVDAGPSAPDADPSAADASVSDPACEGVDEGSPCDDGNPCTEEDSCTGGLCVGGTSTVCPGNDPCRVPACDPEIGCYTTDQPDGSPCTSPAGLCQVATCNAGTCVADPAASVTCPESDDPCVDQLQCDPETGECSIAIFQPVGTSCDADEDLCTVDACNEQGACEATGVTETCEEENAASPCWTWSCTAKTGCYQTTFVEGVSCDDNNPCTYSDVCTVNEFSQELCVGEALPIDDNNPCTDDACVGGEITHDPIDGISCDVQDCDDVGTCAAGVCEAPDSCSCSPVDGGWSAWSLGSCGGAECGFGELLATRTCDNPAPSCGGADCVGDSSEVQLCEVGECAQGFYCDAGACTEQCTPVAGGWTDWVWGPCSVQCGGGVQIGTRTCTNPAPACNGAMCPGDTQTEQSCNTEPCDDGNFPLGISVYDHPEEVVTRNIPEGATTLTFSLWGAGGGGGKPGIGGGGAYVNGQVAVSPGDSVELRVAGGGAVHGGGGASYLFLNGQVVAVAGGGGGAGADGCGGCAGANPGGGSGGAAGAVDVLAQAGTELYKDYGAIGFVQMGGGMGAGPNGPGGGGVANDQSTYSGCANNGFPGVANQGGGGFGNNTCNIFTTGVGSWHVGGSTKNGNGLGGSGGAGYYGGGGGAGKYTYSGGGGGGGSSWVAGTVTLLVSESGSDALPGGQSAPHYDATAGIGGQNDPPGDGQRGLVVLSL